MPSQHQPTTESRPTLIDFIYTVPSPVTTELVALSPYISSIRRVLEITSWKSHWTESWLVLGAWWGICLLAYPGLRYFLPVLLVSALALSGWKSLPSLRPPPLITEKNLQSTISDLTTIHALNPRLPSPPHTHLPTLLRITLIIYLPYLFLTYLIPLRVLLGISGTLLLTWRAPWAQTARRIIWASAYIRWSIYHLLSYLTGTSLPSKILSIQTHQMTSKAPVNSVRFLFTIYENQRWWMGLDWTAALLPAERPSWCSALQTAVSPPNAFSLPAPSVSFLPVTDASMKDGNGKGEGKRMKRTARWSWEEGEWRIMIRKDGNSGVSRVERPLPSDEKDSAGAASGPASRIFKGVGKRRESSDTTGGVGGAAGEGTSGSAGKDEEPELELELEGEVDEGLVLTDLDGWVYGDNKWEGGSAKGGLGKYTRYRRWTRVAILTETVDIVDAGDFGVVHSDDTNSVSAQPQPAQLHDHTSTAPTVLSPPATPTSSTHPSHDIKHEPPTSPTSPTRPQDLQSLSNRGMLRQRLKAAVDGTGVH